MSSSSASAAASTTPPRISVAAPSPVVPPSRRLRVMFCIDSMNIGGTELNAVRTAERLDRSRFDLKVVCFRPNGPLAARYGSAGIPVLAFPISSLYGIRTAKRGLEFAALLRREQTDILHAHDAYSNVFAAMWARLGGARVVTSRRWWAGSPGMVWRQAGRLAHRFSHQVLANAPSISAFLESEGVPASRVTVVSNFLDESAFVPPAVQIREALLAQLGIEPHLRTVGVVANLSPVKDHGSLLQALAILRPRWPQLRVVLVGDGPCRAALEAQVAELGIREQVVFAGRRANNPNLHHLFDVSCLCSTSEGLPNSLLEAMAAGRPVVATDVGATADAVADGETGLLVPASDPVRLSEALDRILSDSKLARDLGAAGLQRARERYSAPAAVGALESLYERLAGVGAHAGAGRRSRSS